VRPPLQLSVQTGKQACSTTVQASVGPHSAQDFPGAVPSGQGTVQPISVQPSSPALQLHLLQLKGSSMLLAPLG
jgi:hypothetical protein